VAVAVVAVAVAAAAAEEEEVVEAVVVDAGVPHRSTSAEASCGASILTAARVVVVSSVGTITRATPLRVTAVPLLSEAAIVGGTCVTICHRLTEIAETGEILDLPQRSEAEQAGLPLLPSLDLLKWRFL
jgi:hypothetical protein